MHSICLAGPLYCWRLAYFHSSQLLNRILLKAIDHIKSNEAIALGGGVPSPGLHHLNTFLDFRI